MSTPDTGPEPGPNPKLPRRVSALWIEAMALDASAVGNLVRLQIPMISSVMRVKEHFSGRPESTAVSVAGVGSFIVLDHPYDAVVKVIHAPYVESKEDDAKDK